MCPEDDNSSSQLVIIIIVYYHTKVATSQWHPASLSLEGSTCTISSVGFY
jgi:hypothetical protein